jgi:uncharacterized protein YkwD
MKRFALVTLFLTALMALTVTGAGHAAGPDATATRLLGAVNALRFAAGVEPLRPDARLACAAGRHAADNARRGALDHTGADGADLAARLARVGYPYRMAAENLALSAGDPEEVVALWRTSPGHHRNLLQPLARMAGIGRTTRDSRQVWVLIVAAENGESGGKQGISSQFPCVSG